MMIKQNYYYLVAGLPDISLEDNKLNWGAADFKELAAEQLNTNDLVLLISGLWRYDNDNVLNRLEDNQQPHNLLGNLSEEEVTALIKNAKDESTDGQWPPIPAYLPELITSYQNSDEKKERKKWENLFADAYYQMGETINNEFIAAWFKLDKDISNLKAAYQAKQHGWDIEKELVGSDEVTKALLKSNARDYGLSGEIPQMEDLLKALEEPEILAREKKIDTIKWEILNDYSFFHYFTIEQIFAFMQKMIWVERWLALDKEKGRNMFKELINELEQRYELPQEY